ncbi:hypothetical protein BU15DRAFT_61699 [Melanogaster broomeanus]|nr:hypothetical protein BU15DRAFT_61699 [Melanogaster broomeanus]
MNSPLKGKRHCRQGCYDSSGVPAAFKGSDCVHRRAKTSRKRSRTQPRGDDGTDSRSQIGTDNSATMQLDVALPPQRTSVPVHRHDIPDPSLTVFPPTNNYVQQSQLPRAEPPSQLAELMNGQPRAFGSLILPEPSSFDFQTCMPFGAEGGCVGGDGTSVPPMTGYEQAVGEIFTPEQMLDILEALGLAGAGGNLEGLVVDGAQDLPLDEQSAGASDVEDTVSCSDRGIGALPAVEDNQVGDTPEEATEHGGALQSSHARNKPRAVYISDDKKRGKAHSERCARVLEALKWLQIACRPYIFLFIARPETILTSNGKAFAFTSPALKAVLKASSRDLEEELYTMTKKHAQLERLTIRDIMALNVQVHHAEEEHARQLAEERARTAAALAESAQLRLAVDSHLQ